MHEGHLLRSVEIHEAAKKKRRAVVVVGGRVDVDRACLDTKIALQNPG